MGLGRATNNWSFPTRKELDRMADMLDKALDAGMLGMSGMDAPIDKLDGDRYRSRALPSTYAWWHERWRLINVLRKRDRILQSAPNINNPLTAVLFFLSTGTRFFKRRKAVPVSLLVAADSKSIKGANVFFSAAARIGNKVFKSNVKFQHMPLPFTLYSDGIDLPVFEEFGAGTAALHIREQLDRNKLMADKEYRRKFRREFAIKKHKPGLWHKDFHDAVIVECPDASLVGKTFGQIGDERGIARSMRSWTYWSTTARRTFAGRRPSATTARRCSTRWPRIPTSSWASPTPVRICAIWPSTTSPCASSSA